MDAVRDWQKSWDTLAGAIDDERSSPCKHCSAARNAKRASGFATFSKRPFPAGYEPPEHALEYYRGLAAPFTPTAVK